MRISIAQPLNYERRNSYLISLLAIDGAIDPIKRLQARATVAVDVLDVQVFFLSNNSSFQKKFPVPCRRFFFYQKYSIMINIFSGPATEFFECSVQCGDCRKYTERSYGPYGESARRRYRRIETVDAESRGRRARSLRAGYVERR